MKDCCANLDNRKKGPGPRGYVGMEAVKDREDTAVTHCSVCECRHLMATADPGVIGLRGSSVG